MTNVAQIDDPPYRISAEHPPWCVRADAGSVVLADVRVGAVVEVAYGGEPVVREHEP